MVTKGIILGHIVLEKGIEVDKEKIEWITKLPTPTTAKHIGSLLGHAGFYKRFIQNFNAIVKPLYKVLLKDALFTWDEKCEESIR